MLILIAAVVIVGGLCLLDLLLTFGVIRRLREHTSILTASAGPGRIVGLAVGESPEPFTVKTISGNVVNGPAGVRAIAFFSSWCPVCPERVPPFVEYVTGNHIPRDSALAIVAADSPTPPAYVHRLAEVAEVCVEGEDGDVNKAFKVTGFPAFCLLDADGAVAASGYDPAALPVPAPV